MQNLIQFFFKYSSALLFVALQIICFVLIVSHNKEQSAISDATMVYFSGIFYNTRDEVARQITIRERNEKLAEDNARLFAQLEASKFNNIIESDTASNPDYIQQYTYIAARVIKNSINQANNHMIINRGKLHGVKKHTAVIGGDGIVGIVTGVSNRYATVMSLFHQQTKVSAAIKNKEFFGSLVWSGDNSTHMNLDAIPRHANVEKGDTVVTSGYSSLFPSGIMVGLVDKVKKVEGSSFHKIEVLLSEDLNKTNYVYVVNNLFQKEIEALELEVENE